MEKTTFVLHLWTLNADFSIKKFKWP